ncbi:DMT family transporter [archaeon]|nr:DMT family transporter [archaeon]
MSWALFSILAALSWAVVNTIDKYVMTKWVRKPIVPVLVLGVIGLIASAVVYFVKGFSYISYFHIFLAFVAAIFYILMTFFYFKAVTIEEISRIVPLFYLSPLFIVVIASVFLGEVFTPAKYAGIFLLVVGAMLITTKSLSKISVGRAFWFMVLSSLALAVNQVITKYLLGFADFWTVFSWVRIGTVFALIPVYIICFRDVVSTVRKHGMKVIGAISINESINVLGVIFITVAASVGYITLVNSLSSIQPLFVLVIAVMLSAFYPRIIKEEIGKSAVLMKLIAIILMVVGAILIS